jgi:Flp pilus assembly protein TadD
MTRLPAEPSTKLPRDFLAYRLLPVVIVFAATVVAYFPLKDAAFLWDDDEYLIANPNLHDVQGLKSTWSNRKANPQYYPVTFTSLWVQYQLFELNWFAYHAVNVLLHATSAALLWIILKRLAIPGALLAALVFALHPVHVESVAWITERKNTLSGVFYLLSLLAWMRSGELMEADRRPPDRVFWLIVSFAMFVLALGSKSVTATLPCVMLLLVYLKGGRVGRAMVPLIPFFIVGVIAGLNTSDLERSHVGARGDEWKLGATMGEELVNRSIIAGRAVWFYLWKLVNPTELVFIYERWDPATFRVWQLMIPASVLALIVALWVWSDRIGRGPFVAMAFFVGTLFPALGFFNVYPMRYSFVADHFQYLASIGPIVLASALLTTMVKRVRFDKRDPVLYSLPMLVVLGLLAHRQTYTMLNLDTLWQHTLEHNPSAWMAHANYGNRMMQIGNLNLAENHLNESLRLKPDNAPAYASLGRVHERRGDDQLAEATYRKAIEIDPKLATPYFEIAMLNRRLGRDEVAIEYLQKTVELMPNHAPARMELGFLYASQRQFARAVEHYQVAVRVSPNSMSARRNLVGALLYLRRLDDASEQIDYVLSRRPDDVQMLVARGIVQESRGLALQAMMTYRRALQLDPSNSDAASNLARLERQQPRR